MWFVPMGRPQPESVPLNAPFKPPCQPYSACSKRVLPLSPFYSGLSHYYQVTSAASRLRRQTTRRRPSLPTHSPLTLSPVAALLEGRHVLDVFAYSKSTRPTSPPTSLPATSQPTHLAYSKAHLSHLDFSRPPTSSHTSRKAPFLSLFPLVLLQDTCMQCPSLRGP